MVVDALAEARFVEKRFVVVALVPVAEPKVRYCIVVEPFMSKSVMLPELALSEPKAPWVENRFVVVAFVPVALSKMIPSVSIRLPEKVEADMEAFVMVEFVKTP